jgi:hypothetical protein
MSGKLSAVKIEVKDFNLHKLFETDPPRDMLAADVDIFVDFLSRMLRISPHKREVPTVLLKHPWLQK